jgi:copper resistance protein D
LQLFIDIYGFLSVTLRGFLLAAQALTIGGLAFLLLPGPRPDFEALQRSARRLLFWSAAALCAGEALSAAALVAMLAGTLDLPLTDLLGADAARIDLVAAALALGVATLVRSTKGSLRAAAVLALTLVAVEVGSTHAASRLHQGTALYLAELAHLFGAGVWIGGIPYFLIALRQAAPDQRGAIVSRFSRISIFAVALLLCGGVAMAVDYVGDLSAFYGTSYGVMLGAKIALLLGLLLLGGMNYLSGRRLRRDPAAPTLRLRRFAEIEIGIGLTVMFCAASLTSLPPARDQPNDRASFAEVIERVAPRFPVRLESPDHASLSTSQPPSLDPSAPRAYAVGETASGPRNAADIAWSEYNHHWAGLFVLGMGLLALAERSRRLAPVARHWPLVFFGLAGFIFLRGDEEVWPLGHLGLIESLRDPEVAQHRFFTVLIILFGLFEWRVRLGRIKAAFAPYVFPMTTAVAAAFMLTHSHGLANPKEELLIEITHTPLALVGVTAGWARWLELRVDGPIRRIAGYVWPAAFAAAGLLLLFYREA